MPTPPLTIRAPVVVESEAIKELITTEEVTVLTTSTFDHDLCPEARLIKTDPSSVGAPRSGSAWPKARYSYLVPSNRVPVNFFTLPLNNLLFISVITRYLFLIC